MELSKQQIEAGIKAVMINERQYYMGNQRSLQQNNSGHKYWTDCANELEAQGITRKTIVQDLGDAEIPLTMEFLKEVVWGHFMVSMTGKQHTSDLTEPQWRMVEKSYTNHLVEKYKLQTDYPCEDRKNFEESFINY